MALALPGVPWGHPRALHVPKEQAGEGQSQGLQGNNPSNLHAAKEPRCHRNSQAIYSDIPEGSLLLLESSDVTGTHAWPHETFQEVPCCQTAGMSQALTGTPWGHPRGLKGCKRTMRTRAATGAPWGHPGVSMLLKRWDGTGTLTSLKESWERYQERKISYQSHSRTRFLAKLHSTTDATVKAQRGKATNKNPKPVNPN